MLSLNIFSFVSLVIFALFPALSTGQRFIPRIFPRVATALACRKFSTELDGFGFGNTISCGCKGDFSAGYGVDVFCAYDEEFCLGDVFCGTPTFKGDYNSNAKSYTEVCFDVTGVTQAFVQDLCIEGRHSVINEFRFAECEATYGGNPCECDVCEAVEGQGGRTVTVDCSAFDGPTIPCFGILGTSS